MEINGKRECVQIQFHRAHLDTIHLSVPKMRYLTRYRHSVEPLRDKTNVTLLAGETIYDRAIFLNLTVGSNFLQDTS